MRELTIEEIITAGAQAAKVYAWGKWINFAKELYGPDTHTVSLTIEAEFDSEGAIPLLTAIQVLDKAGFMLEPGRGSIHYESAVQSCEHFDHDLGINTEEYDDQLADAILEYVEVDLDLPVYFGDTEFAVDKVPARQFDKLWVDE